MSEIVRPTRDGIHGREYISTSIDLGRKPMFLTFDAQGEMAWDVPPLLELPLPILLGQPSLGASPRGMQEIMVQTAQELGTLAILARDQLAPVPAEALGQIMPSYSAGALSLDDPLMSQVRALEILDHPGVLEQVKSLKQRYPELIINIKVPGDEKVVTRVSELTAAGAEVIHIYASEQARGLGGFQDLHLKDLIRRCHLRLVEDQLRDTVTLLFSGGIALAEHVAKAIICGADAIIADLPLLLALECRLCRQCTKGGKCPVEIEHLSAKRGAQRLVNLIGAWNNQLLEIMGAMGMREVRRLRGEVGRAMFIEDLEKEIFAPLFANREAELKREPN
jgi:hypothetical protein